MVLEARATVLKASLGRSSAKATDVHSEQRLAMHRQPMPELVETRLRKSRGKTYGSSAYDTSKKLPAIRLRYASRHLGLSTELPIDSQQVQLKVHALRIPGKGEWLEQAPQRLSRLRPDGQEGGDEHHRQETSPSRSE